ncbi:MAG: HAMP domain-containing protein [Anaerolineae bacterium]|nr:HAMP domain-containing protein [Anaerolineae bacterium]
MRRLEAGDLRQRVKVESTDELGALAHAFNAMADGLARTEQLRRHLVTDVAHEPHAADQHSGLHRSPAGWRGRSKPDRARLHP